MVAVAIAVVYDVDVGGVVVLRYDFDVALHYN